MKFSSAFFWLTMGTSCGLLWTREWTFEFHKIKVIPWVAKEMLASEEVCLMDLIGVVYTSFLSPRLYGILYVSTFRYGAMACKRQAFTAKNHAGFCVYIDIHVLQFLKLMTHGRHLIQCLFLLASQFLYASAKKLNSHVCSVNCLLTYLLIPLSRVLLEKLTGFQLLKNSPHFMEPEGSLPHSQVPATCPYPEPAPSSPYPHIPPPEDPS